MSEPPVAGDVANIEAIVRQRLALLSPIRLELIDDSARHAGHAGARGGGRHYSLLIVAAAFAGQASLARHRLVHEALGDLLQSRIHAISIRPLAPEETPTTASPAS
ncbi:BolA family protein [Candidatus Accumulibacter aalborgensis]|uniref:BolA family protein n=1 Tax=Candidatus Accumulibacter aalborgensis TaxID=1860102 RepID=A0A1A8XP61_9PROT|nr:BolA family protein [Candidatus Accumulibacter aalborgensis]SBT06945.1 BolA family protein [Candidatus Accumulibacter aalborgensis]